MRRARSLVTAVIAVVLVLSASPGNGAVGADPLPPATPGASAELFRSEAVPGTFVGVDGITYDSAPQIVDGLDGEMFFGPEFDIACGLGAGYARSLIAMTKLARVIEKSGRRAMWTAAPSKTSVLGDAIDRAQLPHGRCDLKGLAAQRRLVDSYDDPTFVNIRAKLADDPRQVYWRTDPHWTTVGGAVFAKALARQLNPALARRQRYKLGTETRLGLFNIWRDLDVPETVQTAVPRTSVRTRTAGSSLEDFAAYPEIVLDHTWRSTPARRTWPGRTLLLGDSMLVFALENLRPIFRHGRFMWVEHVDVDDVVEAIVESDTVVLEVLQVFLPLNQVLVSKSFRRAVAKALRRDRQ